MQADVQYVLTAWTLLPANASCFVSASGCLQATIKVSSPGGTVLTYRPVAFMNMGQLQPGGWNPLSGSFTLSASDVAVGTVLLLYFEGPPAGTDVILDDVSLLLCQPPGWKTAAYARIEKVPLSLYPIPLLPSTPPHLPTSTPPLPILSS